MTGIVATIIAASAAACLAPALVFAENEDMAADKAYMGQAPLDCQVVSAE